jgi:hypothetical protein
MAATTISCIVGWQVSPFTDSAAAPIDGENPDPWKNSTETQLKTQPNNLLRKLALHGPLLQQIVKIL